MLELTPTAAVVIAVAVAIGAFAKSVTGMGMPLVGIPVIASFLGVETAVVVMAFPTFVTTVWLLWEHRAVASETRELPVLVITGVVGVVVGTAILRVADPRWLALALASIIFVYLALRFVRPDFALSPAITRRISPVVGTAAGLAQGATGISGPVVSTYLHAFRLSPQAYLFSVNTVFLIFAVAQVFTFIATGLYQERVGLTLIALVPVVLVFPLGLALGRRLDPVRFDRAILVLLFLSGLKQVADALGVT